MFENKNILITGGTGSLGKQLTKRIFQKWPNVKRLIIFSRDEQKQFDMAQIYPEDRGTNYAVKYGKMVAKMIIKNIY